MTTPKEREEIQRYRLDFQTMDAHNSTRMLPQSDGQLILYGDYLKAMRKKDANHLRHLKLAQIEALEEVLKDCPEINDAGQTLAFDFIRMKIEEIRRELEG